MPGGSGKRGITRWTLDKLLKGAGPGADPTEIDLPTDGVSSGVIALWHGTIANIPSGWLICDGNNSTPNLLAKFVEGVASAATDPGATGGALEKTTSGHMHDSGAPTFGVDGFTSRSLSATDSIADIRPPFYDVAFMMKT